MWILPTYRIADQLRIQPDMFDVVIVDEASQAGLEATFLQYLAPRIVVIGDDKQVSPSAVGVDQQQLRDLANQYLYDNPYGSSWQDPQCSLFDVAKMLFTGKLTLVEHRRCVPELIEFSTGSHTSPTASGSCLSASSAPTGSTRSSPFSSRTATSAVRPTRSIPLKPMRSSRRPRSAASTRKAESTSLDLLLRSAHKRGWIQPDAFQFSDIVRQYRNFVHPREQQLRGITPDRDTVLMCWQPVLAVINDLHERLPGRR